MPFQAFMRSQIFNYSMRYLNHDGPPHLSRFVSDAVTAQKPNWLQNSFVDCVYSLGGRCHGFGEWNPCPVSTLVPDEQIYVEFNTGWFSGKVIHYSEQDSAALVKFDIDNTLFHVHVKRHNFILHLPPQPMPPHPRLPQHSELAPSLLSLPPPLPPLAIPYFSEPMESNAYGHLFRYPGEITPPQVPAHRSWGCSSVIQALSHADGHTWLWVYLDGSWDDPLSGSSAIMVWTDGTVLALSIPYPFSGSRDSEFWSFVQCIRYLQSVHFSGKAFFCIDNSQLVDCVDWQLSKTEYPPPSASTQGTWQTIIHSLLSEMTFTVGAGWLKSHVGFQGNELADSFAKYTAHACRVHLYHRPPPQRHSVTFQHNPWCHKFSGAARRRLYPRHQHTAIITPLSFDWSSHYSWFSSFADKWVMGVKGVHGSVPYWEMPDRLCPQCNATHPLDLPSCVAFCAPFRQYLHQMADSWGYSLAPTVHSWLNDPQRTSGELRNFARTLIPHSLYNQMVPGPQHKTIVKDALRSRRAQLTTIVKAICSARRDNPLPDPLPPRVGANPFFTSHGPFSTSDRPPVAPRQVYFAPPPCLNPPHSSPPPNHSEGQSAKPPRVARTPPPTPEQERRPDGSLL